MGFIVKGKAEKKRVEGVRARHRRWMVEGMRVEHRRWKVEGMKTTFVFCCVGVILEYVFFSSG